MSLGDVLIAMVIGLVGLLATVASIDGSRGLVDTSEYRTAAAHIGQKEIERIQSLEYGSVLLDSAPATSTNAFDPGYHVTAGSPPTYRWDQGTGGSAATEQLAVAAGNVCTPGPCLSAAPTAWSDGRLSGKLHRYVTWVDDAACGAACPGDTDFKRVTIAVTEDHDAKRPPVLVSTIVSDPAARKGD